MNGKDLLSVAVGSAATVAVMRARKSIRVRMLVGILRGDPVMYRIKIDNGTVVINRPRTTVVDCTVIGGNPGYYVPLSMN
jgi:hypothetical protein